MFTFVMFKQTNKRTAIMKKLFSQVYQEQIDTATVGTSDEGFDVEIKHKEGRRMFNFGWKNGHTLEECLAKWKKQVDLQVESCKIVESFTGLSIEEVMAHPKYSHSRYMTLFLTSFFILFNI